MIDHEMYTEEEVKRLYEVNFKCKLCPDAKFTTQFAMDAHIRLHHPCKPVEERIE